MKAASRRRVCRALAAFVFFVLPSVSRSAENFIIVQSTTSPQSSGLFEYLLPIFTKKTGIEVRVVAVGTGQALKNAKNGDGDVVLVHSETD
jgi:tungstate transport system substrate-binding protein